MGERAYVAQQARAVEISRSRGGSTLEESVGIRLGADPADVGWDAYRTDDARWVVTAQHGGQVVGTWTFETVGRTVHPQDESARALMGGGPSSVSDAPEATSRSARESSQPNTADTELESTPAAAEPEDHPRPRLVSVTSDPVAPTPTAATPATESDAMTASSSHDGEQAALLEQTDVSTAPRRAKRTKGKKGRASVPSWDEILFGASRPED